MAAHFLARILKHKREAVALLQQRRPLAELEKLLEQVKPALPFREALRNTGQMAVIAEIKRASPSAGIIRERFEVEAIARQYLSAGANAISVLTDPHFFSGDIAFLRQIRPFAKVPLLRKDFIVDPYQLLEARISGADAVLLIVAALSEAELKALLEKTRELGMEALVEVHEEAELQQALNLGVEIIGINNRNLTTFDVDLAVTEKLAPQLPSETTLVSESGLAKPADIQRMKDAGAHALLVGSHFMRQADPGKALEAFKKEIAQCCA